MNDETTDPPLKFAAHDIVTEVLLFTVSTGLLGATGAADALMTVTVEIGLIPTRFLDFILK